MTPYFNTPKYNNWRKSRTNSKKRELSSICPVSVSKFETNGLELAFKNENGESIIFYLPELEANLMLMQIDRAKGKTVKREDYNLDELEKKRYENLKCKKNETNYLNTIK